MCPMMFFSEIDVPCLFVSWSFTDCQCNFRFLENILSLVIKELLQNNLSLEAKNIKERSKHYSSSTQRRAFQQHLGVFAM